MSRNTSRNLPAIVFSVVLHAGVVVLLVLTIDFGSRAVMTPPPPAAPIVQASTIDAAAVEAEVERLRELEARQQAAEAARQAALEQEAREAEHRRQQEENRVAELRAEQERLEREQQAAERQLAQERERAAEEARKAEAARLQREADEREAARLAEEKRKAEAEAARLAEEARQAEEARRLAEAERQRQAAERQRQEAEARARAEAEQVARDQEEINRYTAAMYRRIIAGYVNLSAPGLSCEIRLRLNADGTVLRSDIVRSSGDEIFDRQALRAVEKAVPLPVPTDPRVFQKMSDIIIIFDPD